MVLCTSLVVDYTSQFLNNSQGQCTTNSSGELCLKASSSAQPIRGFATIIQTLAEGSNSPFRPATIEETALLTQWLEYCICVANFSDSQPAVLNELNTTLGRRSFLVANRITVADAVLYYILYPVVASLSMQDKEKLCNISRWFSTVQHCNGLRSAQHKLLTFSKNPLYL